MTMMPIGLQPEQGFMLELLVRWTVLLGLGWMLHAALRRANPRWRIFLWRAVGCGVLLMPALISVTPKFSVPIGIASDETFTPAVPKPVVIKPAPVAATTINTTIAEPVLLSAVELPVAPPVPPSILVRHPWIASVVAWALVALGLLLLSFKRVFVLRRILSNSTPAPEPMQSILRNISSDLGCRPPRLLISASVPAPVLVGIHRPAILLPDSLATESNKDDLTGIFAHEVSHLRSNDLFWARVLKFVATLFWFHPLVWKIRGAHDLACELVCDSVASDYTGSADRYSRTLADVALAVAGQCNLNAGLAMARRPDILIRLASLKRKIDSVPLRRGRKVLALIMGIALTGCITSLQFHPSHAKRPVYSLAGPPEQPNPDKHPTASEIAAATDESITPATAEMKQRIDEKLYILRHYTVIGRPRPWAEASRELHQIGSPAVPQLCAELLGAARPLEISALTRILRMIGDRRAVPALIKRLEMDVPDKISDFGGLKTGDAELDQFMSLYDDRAHAGFDFGRPITELRGALETLTGHSEGTDYLSFNKNGEVTKKMEDDLAKRRRDGARRWRAWWEANKSSLLNSDQLAQAELWARPAVGDTVEPAGLAAFGPMIPSGPGITFDPPIEATLQPDAMVANSTVDFDKGVTSAYVENGGHDASASRYMPNGEDKWRVSLNAVNCYVWPLANGQWDTIENDLRAGRVNMGEPGSSFSHDNSFPQTYFIRTREDGFGVLQILGETPDHQSVRIRYKMIGKGMDTTSRGASIAAPAAPAVVPAQAAPAAKAQTAKATDQIKPAAKPEQVEKIRQTTQTLSTNPQRPAAGRAGNHPVASE